MSNVVYRVYEIVPRVEIGSKSECVLKNVNIQAANPEEAENIIIDKFERGNFTYLPVISL